jgi:DNA (cytosine-5)-methyltransferase 1
MTRPRLLDAFCCEGGCSVGYERAGFEVEGVDLVPQPRYPFTFHQADALEFISEHWQDYDAIAASPTCQTRARVTAWRGSRDNHPDTLTPTLELLRTLPIPWVVENVTEAVTDGTLRPNYLLCGTMFGLPIRRHRAFETSWPALQLSPACHHRPSDLPFMHKGERAFADAMGCTWMTNRGGRQAIPPAYTEFIGAQLLDHLAERVA